MNWRDKSKEIAVELLKKMKEDANGNYTRQDVLDYLQKAAYTGMQFECDNWVLKRQR